MRKLTPRLDPSRGVGWDVVGGYGVSTVRLGAGDDRGRYETKIFAVKDGKIDNWLDLYCARYETQDEAKVGHGQVVAKLTEGKLELA